MALLGTLFRIYIPVSGDFSRNWLHKKRVIRRSEGNTIEWVLEPDGGGGNGMAGLRCFSRHGVGGIALRM